MLRWGILGTATVAADKLAPAMRAAGHDIAVVGSRSRSRAQQFAAHQGARRARGSYDEVVTADDVDAVYIPLPNALHEEWAVKALQAGKHVLCEKPLATSADAARRMAAAAAGAGRVLMEGLWTRAHPRTDALLELVRGGELGAIRAITATLGGTRRDPHDIRFDPALGGGARLDVGCYPVAVSRWVAGEEPDRVRATGRLAATGVDIASAFALGFPSGATATAQVGLDMAPVDELTVVGSRATVRVPQAFNPPSDRPVSLERSDARPLSFHADGYERMIAVFADAVAAGDGQVARLPVDDAIATAAVLDALSA